VIDDVAGTSSAAPSRGRTWVLPFEVILCGSAAFDPTVAVALNAVGGSARRSRVVAAVAAVCGACSVAPARGGVGSMRIGRSGAVRVAAAVRVGINPRGSCRVYVLGRRWEKTARFKTRLCTNGVPNNPGLRDNSDLCATCFL
jgi:hypothetical protein